MSAPIRYIPLNTPGFRGLNKQSVGALLGPEWATRLENTVIDTENRISARKGWVTVTTTTAATGRLEQLHEEQSTGYLFGSGSDNKLYRSTDDGDTWTNVTNTATVTDSNGQFHNFNGKVLYVQAGKICVYAGTNFTDVADVNAPTGGVSLVSSGRVWGVTSTGKSVRYSGLLDHTDWTSSDTGLLDMTSVWQADDTITALHMFNGALVIFGQRNIIVMTDGQGAALGLDPLNLYVADTLNGIGCIARDSVDSVDGDLWFLSQSGLMSFGRLIQERSNPLNNLSQHVQDFMTGYVLAATASEIRGTYSPKDRFYLLSIPNDDTTTDTGVTFCFDTRGGAQDGSVRCAGIWNSLCPRAMVSRVGTADFLMSVFSQTGEVGEYDGYVNEDLGTYTMEYESGWSDMDDPNVKILKRITAIILIGATFLPNIKWAFDFNDRFMYESKLFTGTGDPGEFNIGEYGVSEYNSGSQIVEGSVAGRRSGEHVKVGFSAEISGAVLSIQQLSLYAKKGRLR